MIKLSSGNKNERPKPGNTGFANPKKINVKPIRKTASKRGG